MTVTDAPLYGVRMDSAGKALVALAFALLAVGAFLAFRPVTSEAGYDCGSAFRESGDLFSDELADTLRGGEGKSGCDKARSDAQTLPILLGALGVTAFVAGGVTLRGAPSGRSEPDAP